MERLEVAVEVDVYPTESVERVERAVRNVLGNVNLERRSEGEVTVLWRRDEGLETLGRLREMLRRGRIRDAARALFLRRGEQGVLSFGLNKQAAYAGRISFYRDREAPLGPLRVTITGNVEAAIEYLCERRE